MFTATYNNVSVCVGNLAEVDELFFTQVEILFGIDWWMDCRYATHQNGTIPKTNTNQTLTESI